MATRNFKISIVLALTLIFTVSAMNSGHASKPAAGSETGQFKVLDIQYTDGESPSLVVQGSSQPTYTVYQLFDPLRVVIDIADASIADSLSLPMKVGQGPVSSVAGSILSSKEPVIAKLEIFLAQDQKYSVNRDGNNIVVGFSSVNTAAEKSSLVERIQIVEAQVDKGANGVEVLLKAGQSIKKYSEAELPKSQDRPPRMYIDISGATAPGLSKGIPVFHGGLAGIRTAEREDGVRIVFDSNTNQMFDFKVSPAPEGLQVSITQLQEAAGSQSQGGDPVGELLAGLAEGSSNREKTLGLVNEQLKNVGITDDKFSSAGYDKQKISVDFYKTNLHNVFRLIGSISGYNMVIDEGVTGNLTLSLQEVPWDFMLDVILNLKGLQMEERYNTIVISSAEKSFVWPERVAEDAASELEAPEPEMELVIDEQLSQPPEVIEAKVIQQSGSVLIKEGNLKEGLAKYEKAFDAWPENADLAKRISAICLVDLGYNQKAVDYAKKALKLNPEDIEASLQAAIGLANMGRPEAKKYFAMATSGKRPERAALLSYAAFHEESRDYDAALSILTKFEDLYTHTLETMTAKARVFDKMGQADKALAEYKAILASGYELESDLFEYINSRVSLENKQ